MKNIKAALMTNKIIKKQCMFTKLGETTLTHYNGPSNPVFNNSLVKQETALQLDDPYLNSLLKTDRGAETSYICKVLQNWSS